MDGDCIFVVNVVYAKGEEEINDDDIKTRAFSNMHDAQWYRGVVTKKVYRLYKYQGAYSLSQDLQVDDDDEGDVTNLDDEDDEEEEGANDSAVVNDPNYILVEHRPTCTYIVADRRDKDCLYTLINVRRVFIGEL